MKSPLNVCGAVAPDPVDEFSVAQFVLYEEQANLRVDRRSSCTVLSMQLQFWVMFYILSTIRLLVTNLLLQELLYIGLCKC